jgi:protein SCO1/2
VVTFVYSTCEDTCPAQVQAVRSGLDRLGRDVPVLAVSVDPAGDTPDNVRRFLVKRQVIGRIGYLTGDRSRLAPIWKAYGIRPQGKAFEHSAYVLLIDAQGRQRVSFPVQQLTPEALAHDIRVLQRES